MCSSRTDISLWLLDDCCVCVVCGVTVIYNIIIFLFKLRTECWCVVVCWHGNHRAELVGMRTASFITKQTNNKIGKVFSLQLHMIFLCVLPLATVFIDVEFIYFISASAACCIHGNINTQRTYTDIHQWCVDISIGHSKEKKIKYIWTNNVWLCVFCVVMHFVWVMSKLSFCSLERTLKNKKSKWFCNRNNASWHTK